MKKADQLARLCHADLALIIRRKGRYYTYRSSESETWPPTIREIVCVVQKRRTQANLSQKASYPLPVNLLSKDFENISLKRQESKTDNFSKMESDSIEHLSSKNNSDDDI